MVRAASHAAGHPQRRWPRRITRPMHPAVSTHRNATNPPYGAEQLEEEPAGQVQRPSRDEVVHVAGDRDRVVEVLGVASVEVRVEAVLEGEPVRPQQDEQQRWKDQRARPDSSARLVARYGSRGLRRFSSRADRFGRLDAGLEMTSHSGPSRGLQADPCHLGSAICQTRFRTTTAWLFGSSCKSPSDRSMQIGNATAANTNWNGSSNQNPTVRRMEGSDIPGAPARLHEEVEEVGRHRRPDASERLELHDVEVSSTRRLKDPEPREVVVKIGSEVHRGGRRYQEHAMAARFEHACEFLHHLNRFEDMLEYLHAHHRVDTAGCNAKPASIAPNQAYPRRPRT